MDGAGRIVLFCDAQPFVLRLHVCTAWSICLRVNQKVHKTALRSVEGKKELWERPPQIKTYVELCEKCTERWLVSRFFRLEMRSPTQVWSWSQNCMLTDLAKNAFFYTGAKKAYTNLFSKWNAENEMFSLRFFQTIRSAGRNSERPLLELNPEVPKFWGASKGRWYSSEGYEFIL